MPAFDVGDDFGGIGGPGKRLRAIFVVLGDEPVDGGLQLDDGVEDAAFQASFGELGEEALDGVEPGTGRGHEVKGEALMPGEPGADLGVLVSSVIVEDHVDRLIGRDGGLYGVEEADELLMAVTLHVAAKDSSVEDIQRGEQCRGAEPALLHRQSRLGPVQRLDLAFFRQRSAR